MSAANLWVELTDVHHMRYIYPETLKITKNQMKSVQKGSLNYALKSTLTSSLAQLPYASGLQQKSISFTDAFSEQSEGGRSEIA